MTFEDWFKKGDSDLKAVEILLRDPSPPTDAVCFHCQQAVEKYLKGYLAQKGTEFEKVHALLYLLDLCKQEDSTFDEIKGEIRTLTKYAITPRYPTDIPIEYTLEEAKEASEKARKVTEFIRDKVLGGKGRGE